MNLCTKQRATGAENSIMATKGKVGEKDKLGGWDYVKNRELLNRRTYCIAQDILLNTLQ